MLVGTALGVGPGGAPSALAWHSTDGLTWTPASIEDAIPDYGDSVAATTAGLLATGSRWTDDWRRIVWSSIDGRAWATLPSDRAPAGFDPHAVASSPTVEVAVGRTLGQTGSARAWWRPTT